MEVLLDNINHYTLIDILYLKDTELKKTALSYYLNFIKEIEQSKEGRAILEISEDENIDLAIKQFFKRKKDNNRLIDKYKSIQSIEKSFFEYEEDLTKNTSSKIRPGHIIKMYEPLRTSIAIKNYQCAMCPDVISSDSEVVTYRPLFYDITKKGVLSKTGVLSNSFKVCPHCTDELPTNIQSFEEFSTQLEIAYDHNGSIKNIDYYHISTIVGDGLIVKWFNQTLEEYKVYSTHKREKRKSRECKF